MSAPTKKGRKPSVPGGKRHQVVLSPRAWKEANQRARKDRKTASAVIEGLLAPTE